MCVQHSFTKCFEHPVCRWSPLFSFYYKNQFNLSIENRLWCPLKLNVAITNYGIFVVLMFYVVRKSRWKTLTYYLN